MTSPKEVLSAETFFFLIEMQQVWSLTISEVEYQGMTVLPNKVTFTGPQGEDLDIFGDT